MWHFVRLGIALGVSCRQRIFPGWIIAALASLTALSPANHALATNGTWTNTTSGGLWSVGTNWSGGTVATATDGIADFSTLNITTDDTVHLDSARTIGQLKFGDTAPSNDRVLDNNGNAADILTLAVSTGSPTITVTNDTATISAVLAGTQGLTKSGAGTLLLSNSNTYSGTTTTSVGTLMLGIANALGGTAAGTTIGSGATLDLGAQAVGGERLTISGAGVGGSGALINGGASAAILAGTVTGSTAVSGKAAGTLRVPFANSTRSVPAILAAATPRRELSVRDFGRE